MVVLEDVYTNVCKSAHSYICGNYKRASLQLLPLESFCMPLIVPAVSPHDTVDLLNSRQKSYKYSVSLSLCLILNIISSL